MSSVRPVGPVFFPLDNTLGLLPSQFSPAVVQAIVRLGAIMPFEQAPELLACLIGVHVCSDTVRRLTERAGAAQVAVEERALHQLEQTLPPVPVGAAMQQLSADGAMVPLVHGDWAEVRTLAIGTLEPATDEVPAHATDITYFSRLASAHDFIRETALPCYERGVARAETVIAVTDGAEWLQELIDAHCPDAVRILDFPHAAGYLCQAAHAAFGPGTKETTAWISTWLRELKEGEPRVVIAAIRALPMPDEAACEVRDTAVQYLTKRVEAIAYDRFQQVGYPIGSGMVESANKLVVQARLKGSGMHWSRTNVSPMLALRGSTCSGTWDTVWPAICEELRHQQTEKRRQRYTDRTAKQNRERQEVAAAAEAQRQSSHHQPALKTIVHGRPTANHPWSKGYDQKLIAQARAKT
jgi:hypothetical protein